MAEAARRLLAETGVAPEGIRRAAVYAPDARLAVPILRSLGLGEGVLPRVPLLTRIGNTGVASPLLALAACLEEAEPGDRILVVGYGSGADALLFEATARIRAVDRTRGVAAQLGAGRALQHYGKFLLFRRLVETDPVRAFTGLPVMEREERQDLRLYGQRCAACGAVQYPHRHVCWQCSGKELGEHRLSRRGRVFTFTKDHLVPSPDPPTVMLAADLEGGGRFYTQMTDADPDSGNLRPARGADLPPLPRGRRTGQLLLEVSPAARRLIDSRYFRVATAAATASGCAGVADGCIDPPSISGGSQRL